VEKDRKQMIDKAKKTFIINSMRRASYRWPGRWLAEKRTALGKGLYYCENPECGIIVKKKETQMDHVIPVIPVTGFDSWEGVLDRMFCSPDGFQRLCKACHRVKTDLENSQRPAGDRATKGKKRKKK
jgi:5-methylcytosine-specific restriction endonuclease McrA